jgi:hypothetical protein
MAVALRAANNRDYGKTVSALTRLSISQAVALIKMAADP